MIAEEWFGHGTIRCGISYEQGVKDERERIIKMLEAESFENANGEVAVHELLSVLIALIKGENK